MDEYQIVELVKDRYRMGLIKAEYNLLLNDRTIISEKSYERSYQHDPSISKQVIGYVENNTTEFVSNLEFPSLRWYNILYAYLHKIGYVLSGYSPLGSAALPNLKYYIYCITSKIKDMSSTGYKFKDRLVIELIDLDVVANNLNLPKVMVSVLGSKLLSENNMIERDEFYEIENRTGMQKLFAGHTWYDAEYIVGIYFDRDEHELSKEVFKISEAYERVFRPYRVVYDTKTWQPVVF